MLHMNVSGTTAKTQVSALSSKNERKRHTRSPLLNIVAIWASSFWTAHRCGMQSMSKSFRSRLNLWTSTPLFMKVLQRLLIPEKQQIYSFLGGQTSRQHQPCEQEVEVEVEANEGILQVA